LHFSVVASWQRKLELIVFPRDESNGRHTVAMATSVWTDASFETATAILAPLSGQW